MGLIRFSSVESSEWLYGVLDPLYTSAKLSIYIAGAGWGGC